MTHSGHAVLAAAFAARRCAICGGPANVVCPGSDAEYADSIAATSESTRRNVRLITAAVADINLCLPHAAERWPWRGEKPRKRRSATG
jgi:hypothetical protein